MKPEKCTACGLSSITSLNKPLPLPHLPNPSFSPASCYADAALARKTEINEVEASIKRLQVHLCLLKQTHYYQHNCMAPINRLSDDLLALILHEDWLHYSKMPPWAISSVCRRWRALTLSTTRWWSAVSFPSHKLRENGSAVAAKICPPVIQQFQRSGQATLHSTFGFPPNGTIGKSPVSKAFDLFMNNLYRTERLSLLPGLVPVQGIEFPKAPLSKLTHLTIEDDTWIEYFKPENTPALTSLTFTTATLQEQMEIYYPICVPAFQWVNLTRFHIVDCMVTVETWLFIIRHMVSLEVLFVEGFHPIAELHVNAPEPDDVVQLPRLRDVEIDMRPRHWEPSEVLHPMRMALQQISAPALEVLRIRGIGVTEEDEEDEEENGHTHDVEGMNAADISSLRAFLDRSQPPKLTHFSIDNILNGAHLDLPDLLSSLPFLTHLEIRTPKHYSRSHTTRHDALVLALQWEGAHTEPNQSTDLPDLSPTPDPPYTLCPRLTHLTLAYFTASYDLVRGIMLSRSPSQSESRCSSLQRLDIPNMYFWDQDTLEGLGLRELKKEGLTHGVEISRTDRGWF